jgi:hypothetical protein
MPLMLSEVWKPERLTDYKVHFARYNQEEQPLNVLARSMDDWRAWQEWYPGRNDFSRRYIFSVAQIPGAQDLWMFGGIWKVHGTTVRGDGRRYYDVSLEDDLQSLFGRLKLHRVHRERGTRLNLEGHLGGFVVHEMTCPPEVPSP